LIVQTAQGVLDRLGVVVLNEGVLDARFGESGSAEALEEKSPLIAVDGWLDEEKVRDGGRRDLHGSLG
jgi:hypothetical protein